MAESLRVVNCVVLRLGRVPEGEGITGKRAPGRWVVNFRETLEDADGQISSGTLSRERRALHNQETELCVHVFVYVT